MLKHKITKIKKNKSLQLGICMTFQKHHLLIFFKVTFFRKETKKTGIPSVSNSLDPDQVQCVLGPILIQSLRETSSLIAIQN